MRLNKPKFWDKNYHTLYSIMLWPVSFVYQIITMLRKIFLKSKKFQIPIICIGNIYIGGTGKTPLSMKLRESLKDHFNPVIIRKFYKDHKDEIDLIKKYSKVITCDTRENGIKDAINKNFNLAILDDGFQDIKIKKNINIITFNDKQKIGNGLTIPAGPLRESLSSLKSCDIILINGKKNIQFEESLRKFNNKLEFFYFNYYLKNLEEFKNKKLISFAGIGNPENFFELLKEYRLNVIKEIRFPDHYNYNDKDLEKLIEMESKYKAKLITTEKDYLRISEFKRKRFGFVPIKTNIEKEALLIEQIRKTLK